MRINDFALIGEIKTQYRAHRENGLDREGAVQALLDSYQSEITYGQEDDAMIFWIALADAQYACKELAGPIAEKAKESLKRLSATDFTIADIDILHRQTHYAAAPMPPRKSINPPKKFRCKWNIGDTFAYPLSGFSWEKVGLSGCYMLLRKVAAVESDGYLFPVVSLSVWQNPQFPTTLEEFNQAVLLRLARGRLGAPLNKYEYRVQLNIKKRSQLSSLPLEYIGRFEEFTMPEDEVIFSTPGLLCMIHPPRLDQDLFLYWNAAQHFRSVP